MQGEDREIKVTFPEDYQEESLQGKEATFRVKVHEVKRKELSPLDDEFAKDVSEFDTLEELTSIFSFAAIASKTSSDFNPFRASSRRFSRI